MSKKLTIGSHLLRAALVCVAKGDPRYYLEGVHITPTYIEATNGYVALRMEHGTKTRQDVIIRFGAAIPVAAVSTELHLNSEPYALHRDESGERVGFTVLKILSGRFPDLDRVIPKETDESVIPPLSGHYLSYPLKMFGKTHSTFAVRLAPSGETNACRLIFDRATRQKFGNAQFVVMPMRFSDNDAVEVES